MGNGGVANSSPNYIFAAVFYGMMLLGMAAHGAFGHFTAEASWSWDAFGAAAVVSPIVFLGFFAVVKSDIDAMTGALISFQNGFFWKEIFQAATNSVTGAGG